MRQEQFSRLAGSGPENPEKPSCKNRRENEPLVAQYRDFMSLLALGPFWCRGKPWPNHCRGRSGPNWCRGKSGLNWCRGKSGPNWCRGKSWPNWCRGKSGQNWCRGKSWRNWCRGKSSECAQEVAKRGCNDSHRWNSKFRNREFSKLTFPSASKLVWKSLWGRMPN